MSEKEVKEIDLLELFQRIGFGFVNLAKVCLRALLYLVSFAFRRLHWLAIAGLLGGTLGYFYADKVTSYYSSNMIAATNGIDAEDVVSYLQDLGRYAERGDYKGLAKELHLSEEVARKVKSLQAYLYIDYNYDGRADYIDKGIRNPMDTSQYVVQNRFYLEASVKESSEYFDTLQEGLVKLLRNKPYVNKSNFIYKENLSKRIQAIEEEIVLLDSLQRVEYFKKNVQGYGSKSAEGLLILAPEQTQLYYKEKLLLLDEKQQCEKDLGLSETPITVIKDFGGVSVEENSQGRYIKLFSVIAFMLIYIVLLVTQQKVLSFFKEQLASE